MNRRALFVGTAFGSLCLALVLVMYPLVAQAAPGDNYPTGTGSNGLTFAAGVPVSGDLPYASLVIIAHGTTADLGTCGTRSTTTSAAWEVWVDDGCAFEGGPLLYWQTGDNTTVPTPTASPTPTATPTSYPTVTPAPGTLLDVANRSHDALVSGLAMVILLVATGVGILLGRR